MEKIGGNQKFLSRYGQMKYGGLGGNGGGRAA